MSRKTSSMTIRRAGVADLGSLALLATLDGAAPPPEPVLVAESEGRMLAAVPFDGGRAIADPFEPTAEIVALLELRASQIRNADGRRANRPGLLGRLRARLI
jgi:hypothetical protein